MAKDVQDRVGQLLGSDTARQLAGTAVTELLKGIGKGQGSGITGNGSSKDHRGLSGLRGMAAGAGAAALAPIAAKGIGKLVNGNGVGSLADGPKNLAEGAVSKLGDTVTGKVKEKVDEAGGPSGMLKEAAKSALPFGGGGGGTGGKQDAQGVGKGRRMPIQQSIDIALPVETVYNQWTQVEEWPKFMHRVRRASQEDPCKVSFAVKIWGKTKEFTAEIETQRPDDRIKWKTIEGMNHTGLVTFRELGPNLTRVQLSFDVDPGSLLEKYARGARYIKRAARADLHRFAAFIEMLEHETGAWRGVIEDGEVVEDHDPSYDEQREYGSADELLQNSEDDEEGQQEHDDDDEEKPRAGRNGGGKTQPRRASSRSGSGGRSAAQSRSGSQSRSSGQSRSSRSTKSSSGRSSGGSSSRSGSSKSGGRSSGGSSSRSSRNGSGSGQSKSSGRTRSSSSDSGRGRSRSSTSGRSRAGASRSSRGSDSKHQGRQRTRSRRS